MIGYFLLFENVSISWNVHSRYMKRLHSLSRCHIKKKKLHLKAFENCRTVFIRDAVALQLNRQYPVFMYFFENDNLAHLVKTKNQNQGDLIKFTICFRDIGSQKGFINELLIESQVLQRLQRRNFVSRYHY